MIQLKEMKICPGNEEKHYRIFVLKICVMPWSFPVGKPSNHLWEHNSATPGQLNLCCRSIYVEICSITDANTFSKGLPALNRKRQRPWWCKDAKKERAGPSPSKPSF